MRGFPGRLMFAALPHPGEDSAAALVLGSPIAHSLSPVLHRAAYAEVGLTSWSHGAREVDERGFCSLVASLGPRVRGLSLTMPLKRVAAEVSQRARLTGSVNTLMRDGDRWVGYNTDVRGVIAALGGLAGCGLAMVALRQLGVGRVVVAALDRGCAEASLGVVAAACGLALEAEVTEFLGRERYQRAATITDARPGSRNGYRPVTVKTTAGPVQLERPKLRGTTAAFASRLFGKHVTKTNALESLVIAAFVRGLSVRDVEATLAEALGDQAAISKSTVSTICQAITAEYEQWAARRLEGVSVDYLFLDASFFRMHPGSPAEPVLAAWGISTDGKPIFIGLAPGAGESTDAWVDFLADLRDRGLGSPLLVISDGAQGLIAAIEQIYPKALRQRCLIHRLRNVLAKTPTGMQDEIRDGYWAIFDTTDLDIEPGPALVDLIDTRVRAFAEKYAAIYPAAMKILLTDAAGLSAYLRFPAEHHQRIRHSNFIERTFGETRRRAKVIGRFPGETSCISLVWAVLDRASAGWRGLAMTPAGSRLLHDLRRSLLDPPRELRPRHAHQTDAVTATA